jgi:hypothetical protein
MEEEAGTKQSPPATGGGGSVQLYYSQTKSKHYIVIKPAYR